MHDRHEKTYDFLERIYRLRIGDKFYFLDENRHTNHFDNEEINESLDAARFIVLNQPVLANVWIPVDSGRAAELREHQVFHSVVLQPDTEEILIVECNADLNTEITIESCDRFDRAKTLSNIEDYLLHKYTKLDVNEKGRMEAEQAKQIEMIDFGLDILADAISSVLPSNSVDSSSIQEQFLDIGVAIRKFIAAADFDAPELEPPFTLEADEDDDDDDYEDYPHPDQGAS